MRPLTDFKKASKSLDESSIICHDTSVMPISVIDLLIWPAAVQGGL